MKKANAVVGQSGGPTSVINASLAGIIESAASYDEIGHLYGMHFAIEGLLAEDFVDLSECDEKTVAGLTQTPSSALGSSRHKLADDELPRVLEVLRTFDIRYFFLIGGNDTMDTVHRVEAYCRQEGYDIFGIGVPKTVDNDLYGTDHTPGFPSAARYNILSVQQAGRLAHDMQKVDTFTVFQTIGRDAGWLAGATALARRDSADPPHLIYCPERPFITDDFLKDAIRCIDDHGYVSVVVSEGILHSDGTPVSAARGTDNFNNIEFGAMGGASAAMQVHRLLADATGLRGEFQVTESLPMCAIDRAVSHDITRARDIGMEAVRLAVSGESGWMVSIERTNDKRPQFRLGRAPLGAVALRARMLPEDFINAAGNDMTESFLEYLRPLVGDLPHYVTLGGQR